MRAVNRDLGRHLTVLRSFIRERGFTQMDVQEALGWGRSYISQLLTQQKSLRVEQVLMILNVIGVKPETFFTEVHSGTAVTLGPQRAAAAPTPGGEPPAPSPAELDRLNILLHGLVSVLKKKGLIDASDLTRAVKKARHEP